MDFYMDYAPFSMPKVMRTSGRSFASVPHWDAFELWYDAQKVTF
jgi:hypothetical protein